MNKRNRETRLTGATLGILTMKKKNILSYAQRAHLRLDYI